MADFINCPSAKWPYLCTRKSTYRDMQKTEEQKEATRFSLDYFKYLLQQEQVLERLVERKMSQLEPRIERMIDEKVEQRISQKLNRS